MKLRVFLLALLITGLASCSYKTCPTYAKKDMQKQEVEMKTKAKV